LEQKPAIFSSWTALVPLKDTTEKRIDGEKKKTESRVLNPSFFMMMMMMMMMIVLHKSKIKTDKKGRVCCVSVWSMGVF